jgi:hypothetical protein
LNREISRGAACVTSHSQLAAPGRYWVDDDVLVAVGMEFRPRSLDGLADALLKRSPLQIRTVQRLIVAGLADRPDSEDYVLGPIALPNVTREADKLAAMFAADPGLRAVLPRVFDIEGNRRGPAF